MGILDTVWIALYIYLMIPSFDFTFILIIVPCTTPFLLDLKSIVVTKPALVERISKGKKN